MMVDQSRVCGLNVDTLDDDDSVDSDEIGLEFSEGLEYGQRGIINQR